MSTRNEPHVLGVRRSRLRVQKKDGDEDDDDGSSTAVSASVKSIGPQAAPQGSRLKRFKDEAQKMLSLNTFAHEAAVERILFRHEHRYLHHPRPAKNRITLPADAPQIPPRPDCVEGIRWDALEEEPLSFWGVWFIVAAAMRFKRPIRRRKAIQKYADREKLVANLKAAAQSLQRISFDRDPRYMARKSLQNTIKQSSIALQQQRSAQDRQSRNRESKPQVPRLSILHKSEKETVPLLEGASPPGSARKVQQPQKPSSARNIASARRIVRGDVPSSARSLARAVMKDHPSARKLAHYLDMDMPSTAGPNETAPKQPHLLVAPEIATEAPSPNSASSRAVAALEATQRPTSNSDSSGASGSSESRGGLGKFLFKGEGGLSREGWSRSLAPDLSLVDGSRSLPVPLLDTASLQASAGSTGSRQTPKLRGSPQSSSPAFSPTSPAFAGTPSLGASNADASTAEDIVEIAEPPTEVIVEKRRRGVVEPVVQSGATVERQDVHDHELMDDAVPEYTSLPTASYPPRDADPEEDEQKLRRTDFKTYEEFMWANRVRRNRFHEEECKRLALAEERRQRMLPLKRWFAHRQLENAETLSSKQFSRRLQTFVEDQRMIEAFADLNQKREEWFYEFYQRVTDVRHTEVVAKILEIIRGHFLDSEEEHLNRDTYKELFNLVPDEELVTDDAQFVLFHAAPAYHVTSVDFRELLEMRHVQYRLSVGGLC